MDSCFGASVDLTPLHVGRLMYVVPWRSVNPPPTLRQLMGTGPILFGEQRGRNPQQPPLAAGSFISSAGSQGFPSIARVLVCGYCVVRVSPVCQVFRSVTSARAVHFWRLVQRFAQRSPGSATGFAFPQVAKRCVALSGDHCAKRGSVNAGCAAPASPEWSPGYYPESCH